MPELLAAHIQPNTIEIDRLLSKASELLKTNDLNLSLNGYQDKSRDRVWKQVNAIYQTLLSEGLHYSPPPSSFERSGQKIRTADQIVDSKLVTCLDSTVFFAACLEQAGLNPVILFKAGHCWIGVWLVNTYFANSVEDCAQDIRKRIASGELLTIETTCLTQGASMRKAMADAKPYLEEAQENDFQYAIDVRRARENHIRPMRSDSIAKGPLTGLSIDRTEVGNTFSGLEDAPELPPLDPSAITAEEVVTDHTPEGRLANWKSKLLDLTLRNRLLNFKLSKKFIKVVTHHVGDLEDALASGAEFKLVPKRSLHDQGDPRSEESFFAEFGMSSAQQYAKTVLGKKEICFDVEKGKLQDQATVIFREAKNALDETGSNSLYLALGILCWKETPEAETVLRAPILLVPVKLKRGAVGAGLRLERLDEETIFNPTLIQKLALSFDISIPFVDGQLPADDSGVDVDKIFATLRSKVAEMKGFEVVDECYLGNYSFAKYVMWRDLAKNTEDLLKNAVVNHLVNHHGEVFQDDAETVEPKDLDRDYAPQSLYTPLLADSSQLAVICTAEKGKNMVVEGPPGTGKSQTITNLICHFIASGKTVLFVAEKMAALEVVYKRLSEIGLSEFLLELHSTKAKKSEISKQFIQVLDSSSKQVVDDWEREAERLAALRNELNALVNTLHKVHRCGLSIYCAMGITLTSDANPAGFDWSDSEIHDVKDKRHLEDFVGELAALATRLTRIAGHPLFEVKQIAWTPSWEDQLLQAAQRCVNQVSHVEKCLSELSSVVQVDSGTESLRQLESIADLAKALMRASQVPIETVDHAFNKHDRNSFSELIRHGRTRTVLWSNFKDYDAELKSLKAGPLKLQWRQATQDWWPKKWFSKRKVSNQIRLFSSKKFRIPDEGIDQFLDNLAKLNAEDDYLQQNSGVGHSCLGSQFQAENTDWDSAAAHLCWMEELAYSVQRAFEAQHEKLESSRATLKSLLVDQSESFEPGGRLFNAAKKYSEAHSEFVVTYSDLMKLANNNNFLNGENQAGIFFAIKSLNNDLLSNLNQLQPWCKWNEYRTKALSAGLQGLIQQVEKGDIDLSDLKDHFIFSYANWWLRKVVDKEPLLSGFSGASHIYKIEEFKKADEKFQNLTIQYVQAKLRGKIPAGKELTDALRNEVGFLRKKAQKQRMHRPIREVIQRTSEVLPRLKPCLLMSPQSVAQYLDTTSQMFDVVIFDEASQIPTWDAVGAIARGKQLICVGDPKQLPPTNFFNASDAAGDVDESNIVEMESILDECLSSGMPLSRLSWHYRSRNEGLITFSNYQYYEGKLHTFPSPVEQDNSVEFIDAKGIYEPGKSRTNKIEAEKIVDEIERHYLSGDAKQFSMGVVTFNSSQQALIENLLDARRRANKSLDIAIEEAGTEELFVKNLENVQGDERDVILFSITFGKDATGKLSMNFGPMNKEGGYRRLNVAATRARHKVKIFPD